MTKDAILEFVAKNAEVLGITDPSFEYGKDQGALLRKLLIVSNFSEELAEMGEDSSQALMALVSSEAFGNDAAFVKPICKRVFGVDRPNKKEKAQIRVQANVAELSAMLKK